MQSSSRRNDFIEKVIDIALANFVSGNGKNAIFIKKAKANKLPNGKKILSNLIRYPQYEENDFTYYSANKIQGSNFIAAAGPKIAAIPMDLADTDNRIHHSVEDLFDNTLFNDAFPIANIIALGTDISREKTNGIDFWDYCTQEEKTEIGKYMVNTQVNYGSGFNPIDPKGMVKSTLTVSTKKEQKELNVTFISIRDNTAIDLSDDRVKEELWRQYQLSKTQKTLIHCASGVGRTGHLILIFELLKDYAEIFSGNKAKKSAQKIHKILERIRENRPALVNTRDQFKTAINNAHILHQYALEKKYISSSGTKNLKHTLEEKHISSSSEKNLAPLNFINRLEQYVQKHEKGATCASWCKIFSIFDKSTEINAANKMISLLKTGEIKTAFTGKEIEALRNSELGKIVAQHEEQLPECFKTAEQDKIIAENARPIAFCARM